MKKISFLAIILIGLLAFSGCKFIPIHFAPSLNKEFKNLGIDFSDKESILRLEKDPGLFWLWCKWKPIAHLMTKEEKKLIKKILEIQDAEERNFYQEKFIEYFWKRRDVNLYDDENVSDFKEALYDRVVKAQTRYGNRNTVYDRKCKYGKGWQTDMGLIYILLGKPFDRARHDVNQLMSFYDKNYQQSGFGPQDIEIWYYEVPLDEYDGSLFQDGVAWILFESDMAGYWEYGSSTVSLFFNYENYNSMSRFMGGMGLNYSRYISEIDKLLKAFARENVYDEDLKYEDMLYKWVKVDEKKEDK